jgi:hypothetical protein
MDSIEIPVELHVFNELTSGSKEAAEQNLPEIVDTLKTVGASGRDLAPDGVLADGSVVVPMEPVATTVQGLG